MLSLLRLGAVQSQACSNGVQNPNRQSAGAVGKMHAVGSGMLEMTPDRKKPGMTFWATLVLVAYPPLASAQESLKAQASAYKSPYSVKFTLPMKDLIGDIQTGPRGNIQDESTVPFAQWDSDQVRRRYGSWGPPARHYPAPESLATKSMTWKQERVVAVALSYQGIAYQHHHLPDWEPPAGWPWKETRAGANGCP